MNKDYNKNFINNCILAAINRLRKDIEVTKDYFIIDKDTDKVSGMPNIPTTIKEKISKADIFIGDITFNFIDPKTGEGIPNTNVMQEMGIAEGSIGTERIITVMNITYGLPEKTLPFDLAQSRFPCVYKYGDVSEKDEAKKQLEDCLYSRLKVMFTKELGRTKDYEKPFLNWKEWERSYQPELSFEINDYVVSLFKNLRTRVVKVQTDIRICGLSGIGKTRILFECFRHKADDVPEILTDRLLYVNCFESDEKLILQAIKNLIRENEQKVLVIDNCSIDIHRICIPLVRVKNSRLTIITLSSDPDEKINMIDPEHLTNLIILQNQSSKEIVRKLLKNNFTELEDREINLLVEFSNGIPFIATLMAKDPDRGQYQPGSLRVENIINRLLGKLYDDKHSRAVILSCSLFTEFGYYEDLSFQATHIAQNQDLCQLFFLEANPEDIPDLQVQKFKEVCEALKERQLLEKQGRTLAFRPSPLAIRMAETWWSSCTETKFNRIIPIIQKAGLVESFCRQFRYLKHQSNAQAIVEKLCGGLFSLAEVLNSSTGSRLFRSFVYVNPIASSKALRTAFLDKTIDEIIDISTGRRNLIWALEQLCFREDTFDESSKVLAIFAVGENEEISNNATGQFLQLFHIFLPGTVVNLERRWLLIEYCFNKSKEYTNLSLSSISSALNADQFHRMNGPEDQGDAVLLEDYKPTNKEIYNYWGKCINLLLKISDSSEFGNRAISILFDKFYMLCSFGGSNLIIPAIEEILDKNLIERMQVRNRIIFILNSQRIEKDVIKRLNALLARLTPKSFKEKFEVTVESPSTEDYSEYENYEKADEMQFLRVRNLASEFVNFYMSNDEAIELMSKGSLSQGYNWGRAIALEINDEKTLRKIVESLVVEYRKIEVKERNNSVLQGILAGFNNDNFTISTYNSLLIDKDLWSLSFIIARNSALPYHELVKLFDLTNKNNLSSHNFSVFDYGWGIRHLAKNEAVDFLNKIESIDEYAKGLVFFIFCRWTRNNNELWKEYQPIIRESAFKASETIFKYAYSSMDYLEWSQVIVKLLKGSEDEELATFSISFIINNSNSIENYYNKETCFTKILNILIYEYFEVFWRSFSSLLENPQEKGLSLFHLKDLLGSKHDATEFSSVGLLFEGDKRKFDIVFEWAKSKDFNTIHWIAAMLPIYNTAVRNSNDWHPYAKAFIDYFGQSNEILSALSANMGTYSWSGSIVDKLESDLLLYLKLEKHQFSEVENWAKLNIEQINDRIKRENNRDADGYLGFLESGEMLKL